MLYLSIGYNPCKLEDDSEHENTGDIYWNQLFDL